MRFHDMNSILEASRQAVVEQFSTDENDLYMRTLKLGHETDKTTTEPETLANGARQNYFPCLIKRKTKNKTEKELLFLTSKLAALLIFIDIIRI